MWKRLVGIFCVICAAFTILYLRIGSIATDSFYVQAGQQQSDYTLELTINRGFIYDHELRPLVNQTQKHIAAILVTQENAEEVAEITDLTKQEIQERLQDGKPFLQEVHTAESEDDNIIIFSVYNRYEEEQTAAHLIGYLSDGTGVSGLEKSYQELLEKGKRTAKITYTLDAMGRAIPGTKPQVRYEQESTEGVVLTIDSRIQKICERAGKEIEKGAIVVMDCKTGKLRAVCSFPAYSTYSLSQAMNSEDAPMINRAFTPLSVGSTFKIAVAAAAIEQGIPTSLEYECTGAFQLGETVMHCHNREGHGVLTMEEAMVHSCNPYFINLGPVSYTHLAMLVYCVAGAVGTMFSYLLVFFVTYGFWRLKEAGYYGWLVRILARSILLSLTLNWASGNDANHMAFLISLLFVVQAPFDLLVLWYLEKRRFIFSQKGELPEVTILSGGSLRVKATQGMRKRFCLYSVAYLASFIISLVIVYAAGAVITA